VPATRDGQEHEAIRAIPQTIPRSPGHNQEWFDMMTKGTPAYANFDNAAYLTEIILLGCTPCASVSAAAWNGTAPTCSPPTSRKPPIS
jgi:hypothetical protein